MVPKPMRPTSKVPRFMCFTGVLPFPSSLGMSLVYCSVWDNPAEGHARNDELSHRTI
jgi:hypothetical protein